MTLERTVGLTPRNSRESPRANRQKVPTVDGSLVVSAMATKPQGRAQIAAINIRKSHSYVMG
jgi:hypothetical protein